MLLNYLFKYCQLIKEVIIYNLHHCLKVWGWQEFLMFERIKYEKTSLMFTKATFILSKYSKNSNIVKYHISI